MAEKPNTKTTPSRESSTGDEQQRFSELIRALTPEQLAEALTQALTRPEASV
jgi:hypothetical protein